MKKMLLLAGIVSLFAFNFKILAQENPPPIYEEGEEEEATDLAPEKEPLPKKTVKPKPAPAPAPTPSPAPAPVPPPMEEAAPAPAPAPEQKIQVAPEKPVELPPPPPPPPPIQAAPKAPEVSVPANTAVVQVSPLQEVKAPEDGGPAKDAGSDLSTALPVTYAFYETNSLSPADSLDVFKLFTRSGEGVAIILRPENPASQIACELLAENGELLSQTQAPAVGQPLAFQTSPFDKNAVIYLRVKDLSFVPETPPAELRRYSVELKPIAALLPPAAQAPAVTPPLAAETSPTAASKKEKPAKEIPEWFIYGLGGAGVLLLVAVLIVLIKKRRPPPSP